MSPHTAIDTASRTPRGTRTRDRLLAAARAEILASSGEMELAAVAKRAGVSPGLPYRYFESKSALLVAVVEWFFDRLDDAAYRPTFEEVSSDWWEREKARIETLVDFFYDEPLGVSVVSQLAGDAAVVEAQHRRVTRQVRGASTNVRTGKRLGRVPASVDEELSGALLMGGVHQAINHALMRTPRMRKSRVVNQLHAFMRNVLQIEE
ncbi:MAG: TetR/AcrR family transcriptional regulator [Polyangiales bacterium]